MCGRFSDRFFLILESEGTILYGSDCGGSCLFKSDSDSGDNRILISVLRVFLCGIWALLAAYMKSKFGISEIIVTIMLNYIAINFLGIAIRTFLMDPKGSVPQSARIERDAAFSYLMPPTTLHAGIFLAVGAVILIWILMEKTKYGYEMKVVGMNKRGAKCNGISSDEKYCTLCIFKWWTGRNRRGRRGAGGPKKAFRGSFL